jgi:hypothetical protein
MFDGLTKLAIIWGLLSYTAPKDKKTLSWLSYLLKLHINEMKANKTLIKKINYILDNIEIYGKERQVKQDSNLVYNYLVLFAEDSLQFVNNHKKIRSYNRIIELCLDKYNPDLVECERAIEFSNDVNQILRKLL